MIEEDRECSDILTQLLAVRSSVDRVIEMVITENLTDCLENPADDPKKQRERIEKAIHFLVNRK